MTTRGSFLSACGFRPNAPTPREYRDKGPVAKYPTLEALAAAGPDAIEAIIKPCGLGKSKARDLAGMANMLLREYGGKVPQAMEDLLRLPGVGRKSANLIRGDIFHLPAVVADTHCIRMANRIGFVTDTTDPVQVERALVKVLPPEESNDFCHAA